MGDVIRIQTYPAPRDDAAWRERFEQLPDRVREAIWHCAPTCWPGHAEAVAWAVIAAEEMRILMENEATSG